MSMQHHLVNLIQGHILLVKGPALVRCEGNLCILGKDNNNEVTVRAGKILPFEVNGFSKVKIRIYGNGSCKIVKDDTLGISIWKKVVDRIQERPRRIMIVGGIDTGKSTLTTYLSNITNANSLKVGIIDSDVGQGDLAPPGCIGASFIRKQFLDLRDINAEYYGFIGSISPMGIENIVIDNVRQILDKVAVRTDVCVINTDGYVEERGIDYKLRLAEMIKPDLIITIGNISEKFDKFQVIRVMAPSGITKTRIEREKRRLAQYAKFLDDRKRIFEVKEKKFVFMNKVYDLSILNNNLINRQNTLLSLDILKNMFVGLGIGSDVKGFGIITRITSGKITVKTLYEDEFDTIMLSTIGISHNMRRDYHISLVTK
ncbi:MAG: hypothetical protein EX285_03460 [Thaumarchaeota archaeon]|nr:hypothetical protein [Nitrososphaerota archaeon]